MPVLAWPMMSWPRQRDRQGHRLDREGVGDAGVGERRARSRRGRRSRRTWASARTGASVLVVGGVWSAPREARSGVAVCGLGRTASADTCAFACCGGRRRRRAPGAAAVGGPLRGRTAADRASRPRAVRSAKVRATATMVPARRPIRLASDDAARSDGRRPARPPAPSLRRGATRCDYRRGLATRRPVVDAARRPRLRLRRAGLRSPGSRRDSDLAPTLVGQRLELSRIAGAVERRRPGRWHAHRRARRRPARPPWRRSSRASTTSTSARSRSTWWERPASRPTSAYGVADDFYRARARARRRAARARARACVDDARTRTCRHRARRRAATDGRR